MFEWPTTLVDSMTIEWDESPLAEFIRQELFIMEVSWSNASSCVLSLCFNGT